VIFFNKIGDFVIVRWERRLRRGSTSRLKELMWLCSPSPDPRITLTRHERCWRALKEHWSAPPCRASVIPSFTLAAFYVYNQTPVVVDLLA